MSVLRCGALGALVSLHAVVGAFSVHDTSIFVQETAHVIDSRNALGDRLDALAKVVHDISAALEDHMRFNAHMQAQQAQQYKGEMQGGTGYCFSYETNTRLTTASFVKEARGLVLLSKLSNSPLTRPIYFPMKPL